MLGHIGLVLQRIIGSASQLGNGDVCLIRQADQMRKHEEVRSVLPYLGEDYVPGIQRGSNDGEVALAPRDAQDCCVPNHPVTVGARQREFRCHQIGERIGQSIKFCISGFIIKPRYRHSNLFQRTGIPMLNTPGVPTPKDQDAGDYHQHGQSW